MSETEGAASLEMAEFVGRRAELAPVRQTLCAARLVTLTGPGRIGNTGSGSPMSGGAGLDRRIG